jgi:Oxidoreductase family, NAD-binding Rossmann fold
MGTGVRTMLASSTDRWTPSSARSPTRTSVAWRRPRTRSRSSRRHRINRILLDHPEVTTVGIATPLRTHFGLTREALLADKGVLMEKPLCFTAREAQELCDLVYPEMSRDQVEQVVACLRRALAG